MGDNINVIPREMLCLIPRFGGETNLINLFVRKSEYIIDCFSLPNNPAQDTYIFHSISSRLDGKAASLISEREDVATWEALKNLIVQHFGDPRTEESVAIELESLKIKQNESHSDFCHRIQSVRSVLFSKVNLLQDEGVKAAKMIIYNNQALNTFLYNLSEDMIRIVRLKNCTNLEQALSVVIEEDNFRQQYMSKNKTKQNNQNTQNSQTSFGFKPTYFQTIPVQNFRLPVQQVQQNNRFPVQQRFGAPVPNSGFRMPLQHRFGAPVPNSGFRMQGFPNQRNYAGFPNQYRFGIPNIQPNPRPIQWNQNQFRFGTPNQHQQQNQNPNPLGSGDVSMRTAQPIRHNMTYDQQDVFYTDLENTPTFASDDNFCENYLYYDEDIPIEPESINETPAEFSNNEFLNSGPQGDNDPNFRVTASELTAPK